MIELFRIMPGRYASLQATIDGFQRTGVPLVSYNDTYNLGESAGFGPAGFTEDLGSYYIIPKMVEIFGVSLSTSIQVLYSGTVALAFLAGAIGSWLYCRTRIGKWISVLALAALSIIVAGIGDYYIFAGATAMAFIPWWLYIHDRCGIKAHIVYCTFVGLLASAAHTIRSHSGTGVLIFIITSILLSKNYSKKLKLTLGMILLVSVLVIPSGFNSLVVQKRVAYLKSIDCPYDLSGKRVFWHNVYYSLGYIDNPYGIVSSDSYSVQKAVSINPEVKVYSPEYENILKNEVFRIIKTHPFFVIQTVFAKFGVCLMYLLMFANAGLVLSIYYPKGYRFELPFAAGIAFNMLFGILSKPEYQYLIGLFAFATLYGVYSIDSALSRGALARLRICQKPPPDRDANKERIPESDRNSRCLT